MEVFFFILGVIAVLAAFVSLMIALAEENGGALFAAVVFGALAFVGIHQGFTRDFQATSARHDQIYNDLRTQGYPVKSADILQGENEQYYSPELVVNAGGCQFLVDLDKYNGVYKADVAISSNGSKGYKVLSPAALAKLAAVCNG